MRFKIELNKVHSLTTATDIFVSQNTSSLEAVEYTEKVITFQLPRTKVSPGSLASLSCALHFQPSAQAPAQPSPHPQDSATVQATAQAIRPVDFPVTATILFCEPTESSLMRTGFELRQYDRSLWLKFIKAAADEQKRVDTLLSAMKGVPRG